MKKPNVLKSQIGLNTCLIFTSQSVLTSEDIVIRKDDPVEPTPTQK